MHRYGMDYGRGRMYGGGMDRTSYGADYVSGRGGDRDMYGGGMERAGMRYGAEYGGGWGGHQGGMDRMGGRDDLGGMGRMDRMGGMDRGMNRGPFQGRGQGSDTYYRRDWLTNQGDFSRHFGGGEDYGYRGMGGRESMGGRGGLDHMGGMDRVGGMGRRGGMQGGWERGGYDWGMRGQDRTSYGAGYGDRWESTYPEDIARRNFDRW